MKKIHREFVFTILISIISMGAKSQTSTFQIIRNDAQLPGSLEYSTLKRLNEPLKALAAFYSWVGGSYCSRDSCELTTALSLGKQYSKSQKEIILKYLGRDSNTLKIIEQPYRTGISGGSVFNEYQYLTFNVNYDTVKASYRIAYYNRGKTTFRKATDIYLLHRDELIVLKSSFIP